VSNFAQIGRCDNATVEVTKPAAPITPMS
jgi:hypothetical protein